ncbi:MAG: hypothetical protein Fur0019_11090 [Tibeticola sp.]
MRRAAWIFFFLLSSLLTSLPARAQRALFKVPTRDGVTTTVYWEAAHDAHATVLLFPGGGGGFGHVESGRPTSGNFLVRSTPHFIANGFNVAIFGRANGMPLGWSERTEPEHMADAARVLDFIETQSPLPVWIVGTSRGTASATAMAIHMRDPALAGLVLTAAAVRQATPGAVPQQNLAAIELPVLVYYHQRDACKHCLARETPFILDGLTRAPVRKLLRIDGGANPSGDPCQGQHWHGFIGMEREAVDDIARWMRAPTN